MQGVDIAKPSAAREKLLRTLQEMTESGEISWLHREAGSKVFLYVHLVTDALGFVAVGIGTAQARLEFDTSDAAGDLCLAIAHQVGINYGYGWKDPAQAQYEKDLAARRAKASKVQDEVLRPEVVEQSPQHDRE